jgi:acyl dehydratase
MAEHQLVHAAVGRREVQVGPAQRRQPGAGVVRAARGGLAERRDHYLSKTAGLASPGMDELRWPAPVRPGDTLRLRTTTAGTRRSRSKPDRGLVFTHAELLNTDDSVVLSLKAMNLLRLRRPRD